jgi:hypothetical protein
MKSYLKRIGKSSVHALCIIVLSSGALQTLNNVILNNSSTAHAEGPVFCPKGC